MPTCEAPRLAPPERTKAVRDAPCDRRRSTRLMTGTTPAASRTRWMRAPRGPGRAGTRRTRSRPRLAPREPIGGTPLRPRRRLDATRRRGPSSRPRGAGRSRWSWLQPLAVGEAGLVGEHDQLRAASRVQLDHRPADMRLRGGLADDEPLGDLAVGEP